MAWDAIIQVLLRLGWPEALGGPGSPYGGVCCTRRSAPIGRFVLIFVKDDKLFIVLIFF